ncbi:MAG: hypothetical protein HZB25_06430 [Candidatus Eisenbacteria bacterium]|nr:hypothetical protein [Candidatus Eisenbacteria bacterium]
MRLTAILLIASLLPIVSQVREVSAAGCPSQGSLGAANCYGTVSVTCTDSVATYAVQMKPGYKCAQLTVYTMGPQKAKSIVATPSGWNSKICDDATLNWSIATSKAVPTVGGFKAKYSSCPAGQVFGLHVVPTTGPTFHALAGCIIPTDAVSWGRLRTIYR